MTDTLADEFAVDTLPSDEALDELRRTNLGKLLDEVHVGFDKLALHYLHEAGYPDLKAAHTHVLRTMRIDGSTLTDMAERAGISKQAMSKLVAVFEEWGFVEWRGGQGRQVFATDAGKELLKRGVLALRVAEATFFAALGAQEREALRALLLRTVESQNHHALAGWRRRRA
ncbi:MAG: MarR family winged helix-turn-helix transcriptional regulator [Pseudomonadota bacterium]